MGTTWITLDFAESNRIRLRAGLYAGWELVFRLPITAAD